MSLFFSDHCEVRLMNRLFAVMLGTAAVLVAANCADAGLFCHRDECDECNTCAAPCDCCYSVATACCGVTSGCCGAGQMGMMYGVGQLHGYTGYEGLPAMDGRGVHGRYPYHSYRRPWFHPSPKSANASIVW